MDLESRNLSDLNDPEDSREADDMASTLAGREGLPPSYRMRANAHYVEQLDRRSTASVIRSLAVGSLDPSDESIEPIPALAESVRQHGVLQPLLVYGYQNRFRLVDGHRRLQAAIAAGLREVPCLVREGQDADTAALAREANMLRLPTDARDRVEAHPSAPDISDAAICAVKEIDAATQLLSNPGLSHRVGVHLVRAHVWRVATMLEAAAIVKHGVPAGYTSCSARRVIAAVAERADAECRLGGFSIQLDHEIPESIAISGDPAVLNTALSAMMLASAALLEGKPGLRMTATASVDATRQVVFAVTTVGVLPPSSWQSRAFDETWIERPGGTAAMVWLQAADRIVGAYGGHLSAAATARGTVLKATLPVAAP